jgi:hypothetical protein
MIERSLTDVIGEETRRYHMNTPISMPDNTMEYCNFMLNYYKNNVKGFFSGIYKHLKYDVHLPDHKIKW